MLMLVLISDIEKCFCRCAGTDEGIIHLCSVSSADQYLRTYTTHFGPVYAVRWHPSGAHIFLSASADCTACLWSRDQACHANTPSGYAPSSRGVSLCLISTRTHLVETLTVSVQLRCMWIFGPDVNDLLLLQPSSHQIVRTLHCQGHWCSSHLLICALCTSYLRKQRFSRFRQALLRWPTFSGGLATRPPLRLPAAGAALRWGSHSSTFQSRLHKIRTTLRSRLWRWHGERVHVGLACHKRSKEPRVLLWMQASEQSGIQTLNGDG